MRTLIASVLLAFVVGCGPAEDSGSNTVPSNSGGTAGVNTSKSALLGRWKMPRVTNTGNGMTLNLDGVLTFESARMTNTLDCSFSTGVHLTARASSAADISDGRIRILSSQEDLQEQ